MGIYVSSITINAAKPGGENPLPRFSDTVQNRELAHDGRLSPSETRLLGFQTGKRVLPYLMQEGYTRKKSLQTIKTIVLENEKLKAVFLPEYGGRLYSLFDKAKNRELLFKNEELVFGNLSQRNAWFSGGIEFNFGHYGHCALTCSPMFAAAVEANGYRFLRFYEYERVTSAFCQMDFHLPSGSDTLDMYVKIQSSKNEDMPVYWWTNTALRQTENCRVFSGADRVLFNLPRRSDAADTIPFMSAGYMPEIATFAGDCSFPAKIDFSCEYFFQNDEACSPWEAVGYEDGRMFFEMSVQPLRYRKMFCWGNHPGGRNWQRFLNSPDTEAYVEVQAGIAPSQLHGSILKGGEALEFTQCFGECALPPGALESRWHEAAKEAGKAVFDCLPPKELQRRHERYQAQAENPVCEMLNTGSGWGCLECARLAQKGLRTSGGLPFHSESLSAEQLPWLSLLAKGVLPEHKPPEHAGFLTDKDWLQLLEKSLCIPDGEHWESLLHLGIMYAEGGRFDEARQMWERSVKMKPSPVALRCLAQYYERAGDIGNAVEHMGRALKLPGSDHAAYSEEYLSLLVSAKRYSEAWSYFAALEKRQLTDRCEMTVCIAALKLEKYDYLADFFSREHPDIREGEYVLTDVWRQWQKNIRGESEEAKLPPLPPNIDFNMFE